VTIGNLRAPFVAVIMEEMGRSGPVNVHWLLWNVERAEAIPRNLPKQPEISRPIRAARPQLLRGHRLLRPLPAPGREAQYRFRVFGLSRN
jgi:hypothetical protein